MQQFSELGFGNICICKFSISQARAEDITFLQTDQLGDLFITLPQNVQRYVTASWQFFSPSLDNLQEPLNLGLLISYERIYAPIQCSWTPFKYLEVLRKMEICLENIQFITLDTLHCILWFCQAIIKTFIGIMPNRSSIEYFLTALHFDVSLLVYVYGPYKKEPFVFTVKMLLRTLSIPLHWILSRRSSTITFSSFLGRRIVIIN